MRLPRRSVRLASYFALAAIAWGIWHQLASLGGASKPGLVPDGGAFLVKPYLQLGQSVATFGGTRPGLEILWQGADRDEGWSAEVKPSNGSGWKPVKVAPGHRIALEGIAPHRLYRAGITGLEPGAPFRYRILRDGRHEFEAAARMPRPSGTAHRFVVFGDCAAGTSEQRTVAYQAALAQPDLVVITGDVVYYKGRIAEYLTKFWPVYNSDVASPATGAPLLRSTLFVAAPGNHDVIERDLDRTPDGLAYFYYWSMPLNGPDNSVYTPALRGSEQHRRAFRDAAGDTYPKMTNFSFDYAGAHWTVLDANPYVDWTDSTLRAWIEHDLASAQWADWRFVAFHQPGFHSSKAHADDQRARRVAELLERGNVDLVFNGHVHNYQRSYPLRFVANETAHPKHRAGGHVDGHWTLDQKFDGATQTRPDGIIYIVTGAGGARLYDTEQTDDHNGLLEFTARFVASTHSLTVVDVEPGRLVLRQVSKLGKELDRIVVTKPGRGVADSRATAP